ncbi:MAG: carbon monoxide dehydrogenase subunit G, partial [Alphaproteobacteria bacterium]|nr:carbon monoxide dehydrogenase subunit G [Alphaproteobacteria bacterium]
FSGAVTLSDVDPPRAYTITGQGQGGVAGFVKGSARVTLHDDGGTTVLRYDAKADVGGKLASVGNRLIQGAADKIIGGFFEKFTLWLGAEASTPL